MAAFLSGLFFGRGFLMNRAIFYIIDGLNFYYGLVSAFKQDPIWKKFYWIDIVKLFGSFLISAQELLKIIDFPVSPLDADKSSRQSAFLHANKLLNENIFEIVRGKYIEKPIQCSFCRNTLMRPEKTDVNISVRMQKDCISDKADALVLVNAHADLSSTIRINTQKFST